MTKLQEEKAAEQLKAKFTDDLKEFLASCGAELYQSDDPKSFNVYIHAKRDQEWNITSPQVHLTVPFSKLIN